MEWGGKALVPVSEATTWRPKERLGSCEKDLNRMLFGEKLNCNKFAAGSKYWIKYKFGTITKYI